MILDRVTITGADDSIRTGDLATLSAGFPFVEWGILCSKKQMGGTRFPSKEWLERLYVVFTNYNSSIPKVPMQISCHLCGRWVRELLSLGNIRFISEIGESLFKSFQRVQLNFHAEPHKWNITQLYPVLNTFSKQWIFQFDKVNERILNDMLQNKVDAVPLFDTSGGIGQLPNSWPKPVVHKIATVPLLPSCDPGVAILPLYCGYAGGLGPETLAEQLPKIAEAAGEARIWIDMETRVRSEDDRQFDLKKVRKCLEIAAPFVKG